ncbi:MAG: ABC transporter permease [Tannerella sp.]|nr:ABC transporter permease [Tannerella sp.]
MKNFKTLLLHELAGQIKSFTFVVMIPVSLLISLLVSSFQITSFKDRQATFREQQIQSGKAMENIYFYSQLKVDVYMPPSVLSVFSKGIDESTGNNVTVSALDQPELRTTSQRKNAFAGIFNRMDISDAVRILGIFIVLMAACPIVQDREQQTGKLIFANPVGFFEYYLSKYVAQMTVACIMVFIVFLIPVGWLSIDPQTDFTLASLGAVGGIVMAAILYLSIFVFISLAISAVSSKTAVATLASLTVWVILVFIYPFTATSVIDRLIAVPSDNSISEQTAETDKRIAIENMMFLNETDGFVNMGWCILNISGAPAGLVIEYGTATKDYFDRAKAILDFALPRWWKRMDEVDAMKENQKRQLLYKRTLYNRSTLFIPDCIYQRVCEQSAGTDYDFREKQFLDAVKNYRSMLMDYIRSKDGFGYAFFTQVPESEMLNHYEDYPPEFEERYCKNRIPLNLSDLPQFSMPYRSQRAAPWTGLLLIFFISGILSLSVSHKYLSFK